jgi:beta-lactamase class A
LAAVDTNINRRKALGIGGVAAAGGLIGAGSLIGADQAAGSTSAGPADARSKIARTYAREVARAGGTWSSYISVTEADGSATEVVAERADEVVEAYSVNKIAVATAVLDKIDRGLLSLDQQVEVTADIVIRDTDGIFGLDGAYPSKVTLGHAMAALLTVSDNTAVRLCGLVCPAKELNEILQAKGFVHTQVVPVQNPNRFFLGTTTARETHTLLRKLVAGELLSAASTEYLLAAIRSLTAFTDGIRLRLTSDERLRVATKAGWFEDGRNEAGVVFDDAGAPLATFALFASGKFAGSPAVDSDFSANHPALQARTKLGRTIVDAVAGLSGPAARRFATPAYRPYNGG